MEFVAESLSLSEEDECDIFFIETEFCFDFYLEMKSKRILWTLASQPVRLKLGLSAKRHRVE